MAREQGPRIWPLAIAFTLVFVVGGALGYVVGRPFEAPAPRGTLLPGQIRMPNVAGLTVQDARRVLASLGLEASRSRTAAGQQQPAGVVVGQEIRPGTAVRAPRAIGLVSSKGPGPGPGPRLVFAWSVLIPIDHVGPYRWSSSLVALDGPPVSLGANTRVIGTAEVTPYQVAPARGAMGTGMTVSFRVSSFRRPAWFAIVRAFGRQREAVPGTGITVRRTARGRGLEIRGHCDEVGYQAAPLLAVYTAKSNAGNPLVPFVSLYSFRVRLPLDAVAGAGPVVFRVADTRCASPPIRIR